MKLSDEFEAEISRHDASENDALRFLRKYPGLLRNLFGHSNNYWAVFNEFQLGTNYRTDFLVLSANSGSWQAVLIECEGPKDQIYLKDGSPAKKLRTAQQQIRTWQTFVHANLDTVRAELAKRVRPFGVPAQNYYMGIGGMTADKELESNKTPIKFYYRIMIGRRSSFNQATEDHLSYPGVGYREEVSTYDRAIDCLRTLEADTPELDLRDLFSYHDIRSRVQRPRP
jgi:hypothetical protein